MLQVWGGKGMEGGRIASEGIWQCFIQGVPRWDPHKLKKIIIIDSNCYNRVLLLYTQKSTTHMYGLVTHTIIIIQWYQYLSM